MPTPQLSPNPPGGPSASALLAALQTGGTTHVVTVPDFVQFALHVRLQDPSANIRQVFACSEDQMLTTAAGLYVGGATPVAMMQNQGLYKGMNSLRAVCVDAGVPLVLMVGQFGREQSNFDHPTRQSRRSMVRLMEPVVEAMGLRHWSVADDRDVGRIAEAFEHARTTETAAVVLIDRHVTWN